MLFGTLRNRAALILVAAFGIAALPAAADPIFGPETYQRTTGTSDTYTDAFAVAAARAYRLWVQNGDDGGSRVTSGSIAINGTTVATDTDFARTAELWQKPIALLAGNNSITVTLNGDPGSFITVMILKLGQRPNMTTGRLILPWAASSNLVLDLKNGSHNGYRSVRVVFYDASGAAVASSNRLSFAPRASLSQLASSLIVNGSWSEGSLEIFYSGRGAGRMFGQAVATDATTGVASIIPLQHAGHRRLDPFAQARRD